MNDELIVYYRLSVALAIGLIIGIERGWQGRDAKEGERIAGIRTYALIGLLGGGIALVAEQFGAIVLGISFVGLAGILTAVYVVNLHNLDNEVGITSLVAALLTFVFGVLAAMGEVAIAAASAVVTTFLLSYKPVLHRWIKVLESGELKAGIKLLLLSVALLPILPNQGYGPWQVLNPYSIWWMVVLIAGISFIGYFAIKIAGARRGILYTGLFGGLAASTVVTLDFSRLSKNNPDMSAMLATGILIACGTMYLRMLLVAGVVNPDIFMVMLLPALTMALITYLPVLLFWKKQSSGNAESNTLINNPMELKVALSFGLLLTLIMLLGKALQNWYGEGGVLALAAISGLADVDAITLSLATMSKNDLMIHIAVTGIVIAAVVNSVIKSGIATFVGGRVLGIHVAAPLLTASVCGLLTVWFSYA